MSSTLRFIRVLSDGRPGHENQSAGLAAALARRTGAAVETIRITGHGYFARFRRAAALTWGSPRPELLIATGHATHLPLRHAADRFGAKSVVIMRPTWPKSWFDLCLVPAHDGHKPCRGSNVVLTRGALNRIPEDLPPKQARGMILIGGPSRHHAWDDVPVIEALYEVIRARPELVWTIADSRRTPKSFATALTTLGLKAELMSHARTTSEWLPGQLLAAEEVWVTEDSVSMGYEAVTAGARTGILPVPARRKRGRVYGAVQRLETDGYAMSFATWLERGRKLPPSKPLHETARCAEAVLARLFPRVLRPSEAPLPA
jgi:mitochondrial fission protein ELM1